jgi:hypothetical protein
MGIFFNVFTGTFDFAGGGSAATNSFETIQVPSGTSPVADSPNDILTLAEGPGISIVGNSTTDTITISSTVTESLDLVSYTQFGGL